jgi:hypothetical protein
MLETNMPCSESFVRNQQLGLAFVADHFGVTPRTGWLWDTFGINPQVPQILRQFGLYETAGRAMTARLWAQGATMAWASDLRERHGAPLPVQGGAVDLAFAPFEIRTVIIARGANARVLTRANTIRLIPTRFGWSICLDHHAWLMAWHKGSGAGAPGYHCGRAVEALARRWDGAALGPVAAMNR